MPDPVPPSLWGALDPGILFKWFENHWTPGQRLKIAFKKLLKFDIPTLQLGIKGFYPCPE